MEKLEIKFSKKENDLLIYYPQRCDGQLINNIILSDVLLFNAHKYVNNEKYPFETFNLKNELEKRGYDITTLKFSIEKKKDE